MRTVKIIIAIWVAAAVIATLFGDVTIAGEPGMTSANFLKIGVGAKALGMGGAFTAVADNSSAIYWNAAGLRLLENSQVEFSHQSWYQDIFVENLSIAFPRDRFSFGAGLTYVSYGEVQSFDEFGNPGDELSMYNLAAMFGAAVDLSENVAVGVTAKYIEQSFDIVKGTAFAGDVGLMVGYGGLRLGMSAVNLGTGIKYVEREERLPAAIRTGLSFRQFENKALFSFESCVPFDGPLSIHQGLEINIIEQFHARSGVIYRTGDLSGTSPLSFNLGLGLGYGRGRFDYTFIPSDDYGSDAVHNFSISVSW
jgi:hypothetical protein